MLQSIRGLWIRALVEWSIDEIHTVKGKVLLCESRKVLTEVDTCRVGMYLTIWKDNSEKLIKNSSFSSYTEHLPTYVTRYLCR